MIIPNYMDGWANDLSSYANWLYNNTTGKVKTVLNKITTCYSDSDYEDLLKELADELFNENYLTEQNKIPKVDTIYDCNGKFEFTEENEDEGYY